MSLSVVILAAGKGTRMFSDHPKVLHKLANQPLLQYVVNIAKSLNPENINLIIARSSQEEQMYAYTSNPQMFQCIQNEAFQKQVDILNNKRDKLISK